MRLLARCTTPRIAAPPSRLLARLPTLLPLAARRRVASASSLRTVPRTALAVLTAPHRTLMSAAASTSTAAASAAAPALATDFVKAEAPIVSDFLKWLNSSCTQFHAVEEACTRLRAAGYKLISEKEDGDWSALKPGGKYYFTRNQSTLFAFAVGGAYTPEKGGFTMIAAHTDSPVLKVKPVSKKANNGYLQVAVETYGGGLWNTWFDRDLSVAGRVIVSKDNKTFESKLVRIARPILRIPELAIHLNREINEKGFQFNTQQHLYPILASAVKAELDKPAPAAAAASGGADSKDKKETPVNPEPTDEHHPILLRLLAEQLHCEVSHIRNFELCLYDTQPATTGGALNEFVFARGLDNLEMSFVALTALIDSTKAEAKASFEADAQIRLIALFDNEEVGSASQYGAASNMMSQVLKRIVGAGAAAASHYDGILARSMLVSADMAHGLHPNYSDKHEELHKPALHKGLVIKQNANQRYATTAVTTFLLSELAKRHNLPIQKFVVRNDCACGSTIGPILSANSGLRTIDVGIPQWSMHSIRETSGTADLKTSHALFVAFFNEFRALDDAVAVDTPAAKQA